MWNKISKIYVGTNLVRPKPSPSYTPTANTIMYYPLKWDLLDYSWNNRNPTGFVWTITYPNNAYASLTNFYSNMYNGFNDGTTNSPMTISYWIRDISGTQSYVKPFVIGQDIGGNYWGLEAFADSSGVIAYAITWGSAQNTSYYTISSWAWHNIIVTITPWSQMKLYIDGSLKESVNVNFNMRIGARNGIWGSNDLGGEKISWDLSEIINESVAWSATDVSNYYNAHKSEYWIS